VTALELNARLVLLIAASTPGMTFAKISTALEYGSKPAAIARAMLHRSLEAGNRSEQRAEAAERVA
jgi:hypothetical protein